MLRTAAYRVNETWQYDNKFDKEDPSLFVVLSLPPQATGNTFVVTVTPRNRRDEVLDRDEILWEDGRETMAVEFSPAQIAARHSGTRFQANLYVDANLATSRPFTMR